MEARVATALAHGVVLFVDDDPAILEGIQHTCRKEPYEVLIAGSVVAALVCLSTHRVDVIVSDERMPRGSGSQLLTRVRQEYPEIIRIMLTGEATLGVSVRVINEGLYRLLSKPVKPDELLRVIRDALRLKVVTKERELQHKSRDH